MDYSSGYGQYPSSAFILSTRSAVMPVSGAVVPHVEVFQLYSHRVVPPFQTMTPFWLPTINTALLLSSGVTLTIAHHALRDGNRSKTIGFMWLTVLLGVIFLFVQGYEYVHAYHPARRKT